MSGPGDKLRSLFLTVLVVASGVGGFVSVSGVAAAAGNDVAIDSMVEAGGQVEVVFDTATFSDPPEAGDVDLWIDGTRVVDDGASDVALGGQSWTITGFSRSGRAATFTIESGGSTRDIQANRNLTVEFEGVAQSGATNTDPEAQATVTGAVVSEGGSADTVAAAQRIYRGGDLAIEADATNAAVFVNTTGQDLTTGTDSRFITFDTTSDLFTTGEVNEIEFDGDADNTQYFRLRDLGLSATATDTSIDDETALTVDVSANRGGSPFTATLLDGGATVDTITRDLAGDGQGTADFGTQSDGTYTVRVVDNETSATVTTADISVSSPSENRETDGDGGGGGTDGSEVYYDPAAIRGLVDLPESVQPIVAERETVRVTSEGSGAVTFVGRTAVDSVAFADYTAGEVVVADVGRVGIATTSVSGRVLAATRLAVPDGATDTDATLRMRVPDAVREAVGVNATDLQIVRFADGEWTGLNTTVHAERDDETILTATTRPSPYFAVRVRGTPSASIDVSAPTVTAGEPVVLDAGDSATPYGSLVDYEWTVDGRTVDGAATVVTFDDPGSYAVELRVANDAGTSATATTTVTVAARATPTPPTRTAVSDVTPTETATPPRSPSATTAGTATTSATPTASAAATTTASGPGLGPVAALSALLGLVVVARWRQ